MPSQQCGMNRLKRVLQMMNFINRFSIKKTASGKTGCFFKNVSDPDPADAKFSGGGCGEASGNGLKHL